MRLRERLLRLFILCAVVPLVAIALLGYVRSLRTLDALVESRTRVQVERMAQVFRDRLDHLESDVNLVSANVETQKYLAAVAAGDLARVDGLRAAHEAYLRDVWALMQFAYERLTIRDAGGRTVTLLGEPASPGLPESSPQIRPILRTIRSAVDGAPLGELELRPRAPELVRGVGLDDRFGDRGWNLLFDRSAGRVIVSGAAGELAGGSASVPAPVTAVAEGSGSIRYDAAGERRIASYVGFESPAWTLFATASVDEFAAPLLRQRAIDLILLGVLIVIVFVAFMVLLRRATRSLDQLTAAAERVGKGDLEPELPNEGTDEVGQLAAAFRVMTARVREMLEQVKASRQTAVLGRFAVELAHEIRNPLTSVKLNLQSLERDARQGLLPDESGVVIARSLREIQRVDQALRTALRIGRPAGEPRWFGVHELLRDAVGTVAAEATANDIALGVETHAPCDRARGDADAVRGVFVNILLNAIQAMAPVRPALNGAAVRATTHAAALDTGAPAIEVRIRDNGPGIPAHLRERVFQPFFTTREAGTGLGLSVALQTIQSLGGTLRLAEDPGPGAEIVIVLPLDSGEDTE